MKLTLFSDYALRVLMHLAQQPDRLTSIREIAEVYGVSEHHLTKIVHGLGRAGFVQTVRGRNGGVRLGRDPASIRVGDVVRATEGEETPANCAACAIARTCGLTGVLNQALAAFYGRLDAYTLADIAGLTRPRAA